MNYLLDTHTFIWLDDGSPDLPATARTLLLDPDNSLFLSLVSVWEMQIKSQLGKLMLRLPLQQIVHEQQTTNDLQLLPITVNHIFALQNLSGYHKDPFDRLLIAQALTEQMPIVSRDPVISKYAADVVW